MGAKKFTREECWELQRQAGDLQEKNPNRSFTMYGIKKVKASEIFYEAPAAVIKDFPPGIYLEHQASGESKHPVYEKYDNVTHGNLTEIPLYKVFIEAE